MAALCLSMANLQMRSSAVASGSGSARLCAAAPRREPRVASATASASMNFIVEVVPGANEPGEAALRRFRKGVLNSGVLPEVSLAA